jgi:hypothetical protein
MRRCSVCELIPATTRILCADQQIPFVCLQGGAYGVSPECQGTRALGRAQQAQGALFELLHDHPFDAFGLELSQATKGARQPAAERSRADACPFRMNGHASATESPAEVHGHEWRAVPDHQAHELAALGAATATNAHPP